MTPATLTETLAAEIKLATKNLKLPTEYMRNPEAENFRAVHIYEQNIPQDLFESDDYYPCAVVELMNIEDDLEKGSRAEMGISCGVFAKEADGWKDAFHLMETIRWHLLTYRLIGKKFRLLEMAWQLPDEQPYPFFFIYGQLSYQLFQPQSKGDLYGI